MRAFLSSLAVLTMVLATSSFGDWAPYKAVSGVPQDIVVVDAGLIVVSSSGGAGSAAALWSDGGAIDAPTGNYVGAGLTSSNCLVGLQANQSLVSVGCSLQTASIGGSFTPRRFRITPGQVGLATGTSTFDSLFSASPATATYSQAGFASWQGRAPRSIGVAQVHGAEIAVFNQASNSITYSIDGGAPIASAMTFSAFDAVPFAQESHPALLASLSDGGLVLVDSIEGAPPQATSLALEGRAAQYVAFVPGDAVPPRGYGVVTTASGVVLSPIPDPSAMGVNWVVRPGAPSLVGRTHCLDSTWCAGFGDGGVPWVLENRHAPTFEIDAGSFVSGVSSMLAVDAGDLDGDPVFIHWSSPMATLTPLTPDGRRVSVLASITACTGSIPLTITAWDGKAGHETTAMLQVPIVSATADAGVLTVTPRGLMVAANSGATTFTVSLDAGCESIGSIDWFASDGQHASAPTFEWVAPRNVCVSNGVPFTVTATAGALHDTTTITVMPWGPPDTPVLGAFSQNAGTSVTYTPSDLGHVCASSQGFPGVALEWVYDAGVLSVEEVDGGLRVTAPACQSATLHAEARRVMTMNHDTSDAGSLDVVVVSQLEPITAATPFSMNFVYEAGTAVASGRFEVDAGCLSSRHLSAQVIVSRADGGVVADTVFANVPGAWSIALPSGCNGGDFTARAQLLVNDTPSGAVDSAAFTSHSARVGLGSLSPTSIEVVCGSGAAGTLSIDAPVGTCAASVSSWVALDGPTVNFSNDMGRSVEISTENKGFDLIGQAVTLRIGVDAGVGNAAEVERTLTFTAPRFVRIDTHLSPLSATSEDLVVAVIQLTNVSACDVANLRVETALAGLVPYTSTVRARGRETVAMIDDKGLRIDALALEARETVEVEFLGRPKLLGTPSVHAEAFIREQVVSLEAAAPVAPANCGCTSSPETLAWVMVMGLVLRRRRHE